MYEVIDSKTDGIMGTYKNRSRATNLAGYTQIVQVFGFLWVGGRASMEYTLTPYDMANLGDPRNKHNVSDWLDKHAGDFEAILDFRAAFTVGDESIVHDWKSEENEMAFNDCMFPSED